jgi:hypothetical protein
MDGHWRHIKLTFLHIVVGLKTNWTMKTITISHSLLWANGLTLAAGIALKFNQQLHLSFQAVNTQQTSHISCDNLHCKMILEAVLCPANLEQTLLSRSFIFAATRTEWTLNTIFNASNSSYNYYISCKKYMHLYSQDQLKLVCHFLQQQFDDSRHKPSAVT